MSQLRLRTLLLLVLAFGLAAITLLLYPWMAAGALAPGIGDQTWQSRNFLHFSSNAFFSWKLDEFFRFSELVWPASLSSEAIMASISVFVFSVSLGALLSLLDLSRHPALTTFFTAWSVGLILLLFGGDLTLLAGIAWVPAGTLLLILAAGYSSHSLTSIAPFMIFSIFLGLRLAKSAQLFALPAVAFCIALASIIMPRTANSHARTPAFKICAFLILFPSIVFALLGRELTFPNYPHHARLLLEGADVAPPHPLLYQAPPIASIDWNYLLQIASYVGIIAVLTSSLLFVLMSSWRDRFSRRWLMLPMLLGTVLLVEAVLPHAVRALAPLATLSRVLPGLAFAPVIPLVAALTVIATGVSLFVSKRSILSLVLFCVFALVPYQQSLRSYSLKKQLGSLLLPNAGELYSEQHTACSTGAGCTSGQRLISPSYALLRSHGYKAVDRTRERSEQIQFVRGRRWNYQLSTSDGGNQRRLRKMSDNLSSTRWYVKDTGQDGAEWIHIRFPTPRPLEGLMLATGDYRADFPAGLRVSFRQKCAPEFSIDSSREQFDTVIEHKRWNGPIEFTSDGYPYIGMRQDVRLIFPESVTAQCVLIEQLRPHPREWSVAELRFGVLASEPTISG